MNVARLEALDKAIRDSARRLARSKTAQQWLAAESELLFLIKKVREERNA